MIDETAMMGEDAGAEGGYNIPDQIETAEWAQAPGQPGLPPCLMNPPKLQERRWMAEWLPSQSNE